MNDNSLLEKYTQLIQRFIDGTINAAQFEKTYLRMFLSEGADLSEREFAILNKLFTDVDAFCGDESLRGEDDIDEDELLECAKTALNELDRA